MIRRTAMITAGSIAGLVLAGGIAAGANIGILRAADESPLGELSAQTPLAVSVAAQPSVSAAPEPVTVVPAEADAAVSDSADPAAATTVVVDEAGELDIVAGAQDLSLAAARTNAGWSWQQESSGDDQLVVAFTSTDGQVLQVTAHRGANDTIEAGVQRLAPDGSTSMPAAQPQGDQGYEDDDHDEHDEYEDDEYEDDDHEDDEDDDHDEHEDEEHEGGEDDD